MQPASDQSESTSRQLRQVPVAAGDVHAADAELSDLAVGKGAQVIGLENDVAEVGEG